jgi:hypothetical protein
MTIKYLEDGRIADEFDIGEEPYILRDALVMTQESYDALTAEEIQSLKQQRYDNWIPIATAVSE